MSLRPKAKSEVFRACFFPRIRTLESAWRSQMKFNAEIAPPARTNNPVRRSKMKEAATAKKMDTASTSKGMRLRIFSSAGSVFDIVLFSIIRFLCPLVFSLFPVGSILAEGCRHQRPYQAGGRRISSMGVFQGFYRGDIREKGRQRWKKVA